MPELVLASTSIYRGQLLERLGVPFQTRAPLVDEESLKDPTLKPRELAKLLAHAKAASVANLEPEKVVIGCDQLVSFEGRIFGKPGTATAAVDQLLAMSGRSHELITAVSVQHEGVTIDHLDITTLWIRRLTTVEARRYVDRDQPLDCAGSYKLESKGITLFERIESKDHSAITGLPLIALTSILLGLGFAIP